MENLKSISYTENELGEVGTKMLAGFLKNTTVNIKSIVLSNLNTKAKYIEKILKADAGKCVLERIRISGIVFCEINSKPEVEGTGIPYHLD